MGALLGCGTAASDNPGAQLREARSCTDVPCCGLFVALWIGMAILFSTSVNQGADPDNLIRGVDFNGKICGKSASVAGKPLAAWPDPAVYAFKICVDDCARTLDMPDTFKTRGYKSQKFLDYCLPDDSDVEKPDEFDDASSRTQRALGDLEIAWPVLVASGFVAVIMAFTFAFIVRKFAGTLVWGTLILITLGGVLVGATLISKANDRANDPTASTDSERAARFAAYGVFAAVGIFVLVIFFLRKRILIAVEIVKEASKAVQSMPQLLVFPLLPFLFTVAFFTFWVMLGLYVYSVKEEVTTEVPEAIRRLPAFNSLASYTRLKRVDRGGPASFHLFSLFWNLQFIVYFSYSVIAGAVATWYFTPYQNGHKRLPPGPVGASLKRVSLYHTGSVAFGSLVIAIIDFLRAVIHFIDRKTSGADNRVARAVACCVQCCLGCVRWCLDKVSKSGFVWMSIYGDAFCPSALAAFGLLWRNLIRVAAVSVVGDTLMALGKVMIAVATTGIASLILSQASAFEDISSSVLPLVLVFLVSWVVGALFMVIYETSIDTILFCFLVDEEQNKQSGTMLASPELVAVVDKYAAESQEQANEAQKFTQGKEPLLGAQ